MTSHQPRPAENRPTSRTIGLLAEFDDPHTLVEACDQARQFGYTQTDAYSPFPVHGIDPALGIRRTRLPFFVVSVGIGAAFFAVFLQWYANAASFSPFWPGYNYIIGGKPYWSLPANIPVVFEITVLLSSFATFFGMWTLNKLPRFANPLHRMERFKRATSDRFFLMIESEDKKFDRESTANQLNQWGAIAVEPVVEDLTDAELPRWIKPLGVCMLVLAIVPPVMILRARGMTSALPRLHVNPDMDWQYKSKAQTVSPRWDGSDREFLFADGRAMRPPVPGTISRDAYEVDEQGDLQVDPTYLQGIRPGSTPTASNDGSSATTRFTSTSLAANAQDDAANQESADQAGSGTPGGASAAGQALEPNWVTAIPPEIPINEETLNRGKEKFNIYCSACHGYAGDGDGLVSRRAMELSAVQKAAWTPARNLHDETVRVQPVGKIFDTITNGRSTMAGYGSQIPVADRWAIVLYVRALQNAEFSSMDQVPEPLRASVPAAERIGFEEAADESASQDQGADASTDDSKAQN